MSSNLALNPVLFENQVSEKASEVKEAREKLILLREKTGISYDHISKSINYVYSKTALNQFANDKFTGDNLRLARSIKPILEKKEDSLGLSGNSCFCFTGNAQKSWTVLQICDQDRDMGLIEGDAGAGKTEAAREYRRQEISPALITCDITRRMVGQILGAIIEELEIGVRVGTHAYYLGKIIKTLKDNPRLLIFDECGFLSWESIEAIRVIHDTAHVGVVFVGQTRFYEQMRGSRRSYLYDQIVSRIGCRVHLGAIEKKDVRMICDAICPTGLDKESLEFLYSKARGTGKFRVMVKILRRAIKIAEREKVAVNLATLREANSLLLL